MPSPRKDESQSDFITRCMSDAEAVSDFPQAAQRRAVCQSLWDGRNRSSNAASVAEDAIDRRGGVVGQETGIADGHTHVLESGGRTSGKDGHLHRWGPDDSQTSSVNGHVHSIGRDRTG